MVKALDKATFDTFGENSGYCLIDFYADWCGPCKRLAPILEELSEESDIPFYHVNVDEEEELAAVFGVSSVPTVHIMKGNKIAATSIGLVPKEAILRTIAEAKAK